MCNDPIADTPSEALYLRDEETAEMWTPTPLPAGRGVCQIRHGAGYTKWSGGSQEIEHELLVFVPVDDPVKVVRLRLHNLLPRARRVTATYYAKWLLGALPNRSRPFVVCEYDAALHALVARSPWNPDFSERVEFLTSTRAPHSLTADRQNFLGREGDPASPAALGRWDLGSRTSPGADPCAAFQVHLDIAPEDTVEVVFVLGQGNDHGHMAELVRRWPPTGPHTPLDMTRRLCGSSGLADHDVRTPPGGECATSCRSAPAAGWLPTQVDHVAILREPDQKAA